ncbi:hypothetical protein HNY73_011036 [Argiope bruennichi]|uniref:DUF5641 domain-containing protein n=1 Tax=Argiope bruennichi TaxID=94029 RepID=A0A8T0F511_ARGBR|nr:hypothetical protein HNY73_011036 [Argiope bruennichi]
MHSMTFPVNKLWQLEVLGISSPTESEGGKDDIDLNDFNDKMKILPDGRYEVELPWKHASKNLPSNKELVWKRHEKMMSKFGNGEFFSNYKKFYDPLGMLTPSTLLPKFISQDLWKSRYSWDDELPFNVTEMFSKWLNEMYLLKEVSLPCFMNFNETSELHVFVDACKEAYAACVFVRSEEEGEIKVRLIRAKNRVAPLKSLRISRLELMACCIGARLVNSVIKAIDAPNIKVTFWSDSTVALWGSKNMATENAEELIPLTPSMFLIENKSSNTEDIEELSSKCLNKRKQYRNNLLKDLRQRFRKEYLGQLVQKHNEKYSRSPQVGEIVLVGNDNKKRLFWVLAKIIELIPGRDGKIRTVKLKTQHGTALRPIQRIYPLEIHSNQPIHKEPTEGESNSHDVCHNRNKSAPAADVIMRKYTSSDRCVKAPKKLDLLNNVCYVLETFFEFQGGWEDVVKRSEM